jgi:hypothetical protein
LICWMVWWCCENCVFFWLLLSGRMELCLSPQPCTTSCCLLSSIAEVVTTPHSVSVTELLVRCLPVCVILLRSDPLPYLTCDVMMWLFWYTCVVYPKC